MHQYSIVIPCYRSGKWLDELVSRISAAMSASGSAFEILLVNDASPDDTWQVICDLARRYTSVRGLDLQFNVGQYRATLCGLQHAQGRFLITMDDDLQHPPEELPRLISALAEHPEWDCVMGRYHTKRHGLLRNAGSRLMRSLNVWLYDAPRHITPSSFRIMTRQLAQALCQHETVRPILSPLIFRTTHRLGNVDIQHAPRSYGRSGYRLSRLLSILADSFLSATTLPLRLVSGLGLVAASGSVALGLYYLIRYFTHRTRVQGFTTQVLLIIFFGGLTLFAIGLVGEYLSRVIDEVRRPPRYVVRQSVPPAPGAGE
jgi:dolichol-phosphate mannosyltransferase/undecaprenyl-phosphate 4-deoxy-4-formamido-L-arabinose transferase